MSDFHLRADDLPDDRGERVKVMANGFATALEHAQADPEMRLRMILGEAYAKIAATVEWLRLEILKEPLPVRNMADKCCRDPELLLRRIDGDVGATQLKLLLLALRKDG